MYCDPYIAVVLFLIIVYTRINFRAKVDHHLQDYGKSKCPFLIPRLFGISLSLLVINATWQSKKTFTNRSVMSQSLLCLIWILGTLSNKQQ